MTEIITSLSLAELIASLALLVALSSFSYTRRAIKTSLKPDLVLEHDFKSPEKMRIRVRNDGIGPAKIIKVKVSLKGFSKNIIMIPGGNMLHTNGSPWELSLTTMGLNRETLSFPEKK